jgi:hypothetical protein
MIEPDEQRRWWFATHPEYSWSNKGGKNSEEGEEEGEGGRVSMADVDAYVDVALKHVGGPVADGLQSVRQNFGTEAALRNQWLNVLEAWGSNGEYGRASLVMYQVDCGAFMPRLPTTQELYRWPNQMAREFFRWLDAVLQDNPLLTDPNSLEGHHNLPKEFVKYFLDCGLKVKDFMMIIKAGQHRLLPDGWHTGEGRGGEWNREWRQFIKYHPPENSEERQDQIVDQLEKMLRKRGVDPERVLPPRKRKRR